MLILTSTSYGRLVYVAFFSLAHLTDDVLFLHYP